MYTIYTFTTLLIASYLSFKKHDFERERKKREITERIRLLPSTWTIPEDIYLQVHAIDVTVNDGRNIKA